MSPSVWRAKIQRAALARCAVLAGAWLTACATREVPASFPRDAAASPDAKEAPAASIGAALAEDPPLPGESTARWPGLDDGKSPTGGASAPHAHHHHGAHQPPKPQGEPSHRLGGAHVHGAQDQASPQGGEHDGAR